MPSAAARSVDVSASSSAYPDFDAAVSLEASS